MNTHVYPIQIYIIVSKKMAKVNTFWWWKVDMATLEKKLSREWEVKPYIEKKIFAKDKSDKGLLSKIYKTLLKLDDKKKKQLKVYKRSEWTTYQRIYTVDNWAHEKIFSIRYHWGIQT